jgi:hypothetical protein
MIWVAYIMPKGVPDGTNTYLAKARSRFAASRRSDA